MSNIIDAQQFRRMVIAGANRLQANKEEVDELNVFPVPDGDTGTNMSLTVNSAAREVLKLDADANVGDVAKAASSGALRGARGNSGVIVSQLFRGIYKALKDAENITTAVFAEALKRGVETAYKAVMRPKEGTILTVARGAADAAAEAAVTITDMIELFDVLLAKGNEVLDQTPEMLPVLKEAGVVDAGGKGLLYIYEGMLSSMKGEGDDTELNEAGVVHHGDTPVGSEDTVKAAEAETEAQESEAAHGRAQATFDTGSIENGYCTEYIVHCPKPNAEEYEEEVREYLSSIGDSLVVVADDEIIKIHVHTNNPGLAIQKGLEYGYLTNMKIDNMRIQHQNLVVENAAVEASAASEAPAEPEAPKKPYGFVAISMGEGLTGIFHELGVEEVISGGQTMNPSTEDILEAIHKLNAEVTYILPNNKNIILAAQQAAMIEEDRNIQVVRTKNVAQGFSCMLAFDAEAAPEDNVAAMEEMMASVHVGQTTFAIRDTSVNNLAIHKDDILGIMDGEMAFVDREIPVVAKHLIDSLMENDAELLTIYYGEGVTEEDAEALKAYAEEKNDGCEVEVLYGGQPLYHYLISAE